MKKALLIAAVLLGLFLIGGGIFLWNMYQEMMVMETIQYDSQLTIITGGGSNSILLTSEDGSSALLVDTKIFSGSKKLKEMVKAGDITLVITHNHPDHIYGIPLFPTAKIIAGSFPKEKWNILFSKNRYPDIILKHGEEKIIKIGKETVHIRNMGQAHSTNDVIVYFENRKLLVTGDLVFLNMHPVLAAGETKVSSWIEFLDKLYGYDIKIVVPGHGKVMDKNAIHIMKDYFTSFIDAQGDKKKLQALKMKYKDYTSLPANLSFDINADFIEKEGKLLK
jgi:glyoxylase-like metal-dependent hydrolase (beta-lactamase superfamily II)